MTPFRHYSLRHRITAWVSLYLFDHVTYTVRHGLLRGMRRKGGLGWIPGMSPGSDLTPEESFIKKMSLDDKVVYDVGAFHGLLTMFFATGARTVVAYEPNSKNRNRLQENLQLNGLNNVVVRPYAVGSRPQAATMTWSPLMPGGGSLKEETVSNLQQSSTAISEEIEITTLDKDIEDERLPAPDFIKIDIEGLELEALRGARATITRRRPTLYLEMHGETMKIKKRAVFEIVEFLKELGCASIQHVETGTTITLDNSDVAAEGHLFVTWVDSP